VVANEAGGPRLVVDIVPFTSTGQVEPFEGSVSLMLLTTEQDGREHNLGRWDFAPADVHAAIDPQAAEPAMRFFIELPASVPVDRATQLWVRLVSPNKTKLLAHANVDLKQPGAFSSRAPHVWPAEEQVMAATYEEKSPESGVVEAPSAPSLAASVDDFANDVTVADWAVARPGKPVNLSAEAQGLTGGGWRVSSEPMPQLAIPSRPATTSVAKSARSKKRVRHEDKVAEEEVEHRPASRPEWAPERSGDSPVRVSERPSWSATR
jgi:hypothetical protein